MSARRKKSWGSWAETADRPAIENGYNLHATVTPPAQRARHFPFVALLLFISTTLSAQINVHEVKVGIVPCDEIVPASTSTAHWKLLYGAGGWAYHTQREFKTVVLNAHDGNSWLARANWLRRIDPHTGNVLGKWRVPGAIRAIQETGLGKVRIYYAANVYRPKIESVTLESTQPNGASPPLLLNGTFRDSAADEAAAYYPMYELGPKFHVPPETALENLRQLNDLLKHDKLSPWLHMVRARLRKDAGDPGWKSSLDDACAISTDPADSFRLATRLAGMNEVERTQRVFESGMKEFLRSGLDPRLQWVFFYSMLSFSPFQNRESLDESWRWQAQEDLYQFAPQTMISSLMWRQMAIRAQIHGEPKEATKWQQRAERSSGLPRFLEGTDGSISLDRMGAWIVAITFALIIFLFSLHIRYDADLYSTDNAPEFEFFGVSRIQFWPRSTRTILLALAIIGWVLCGMCGVILTRTVNFSYYDIGVNGGHIGSMLQSNVFNALPKSPEHLLIEALAHQQSGEPSEAEKLYRGLPEFAMSWNNLGVLLDEQDKKDLAKEAYQRAVNLKPGMEEAAYNLTGNTEDSVSTSLARYAPGQKMLAIPSGEQWETALDAGNHPSHWLKGPLSWPFGRESFQIYYELPVLVRALMGFCALTLGGSLSLGILLVFLPNRVPGRAPSSTPRIDLLVPGSSPMFSILSPVLTTCFLWMLMQAALTLIFKSSLLLTSNLNNYVTHYFSFSNDIFQKALAQLSPPAWQLVGGVLAAFIVNTLLVKWQERRKGPA